MKEKELALARELYYKLNIRHKRFNTLGDWFSLLAMITIIIAGVDLVLLFYLQSTVLFFTILISLVVSFIIVGYNISVAAKKQRLNARENLIYRLTGTVLRLDLVRKYPFLASEKATLIKSLKSLRSQPIFKKQIQQQNKRTGITSEQRNAIFFGRLHLFIKKLIKSISAGTPYAEMHKVQYSLVEIIKAVQKQQFGDKKVLNLMPKLPKNEPLPNHVTRWIIRKLSTKIGKAVLITAGILAALSFASPFEGLTALQKNISSLLTVVALLQGSVWLLEFLENKPNA